MAEQIPFECLEYQQLSLDQLYQILLLRQRVFMLEQTSLYLDLDELDQQAWHVCSWQQQHLVAYTRLRVAEAQRVAKIERVVIDSEYRGAGLAKGMMQFCMQWIERQNVTDIRLSAQLAVLDFYRKWGFEVEGEPFDDGGVLHQNMRRVLV